MLKCSGCNAVVAAEAIEVTSQGLRFECGRCGTGATLPSTSPPSQSASLTQNAENATESRCPKCDAVVGQTSTACSSCGLMTSKFESFAAHDGQRVPGALHKLWERLCERWDDSAEHDKFLERIVVERAFSFAAKKYREAIRKNPNDSVAPGRLEALTRMAEATLLAASRNAKMAAEPEPFRGVVIMMIVLLLGGGVLGVSAFLKFGKSPEPLEHVRPAESLGHSTSNRGTPAPAFTAPGTVRPGSRVSDFAGQGSAALETKRNDSPR